jgi:hypothetical protein
MVSSGLLQEPHGVKKRFLQESNDVTTQKTPFLSKISLTLFIHLRLGLPSDFFHSGFLTNILIRVTCPSYLIFLDMIISVTLN